MHCPNCGTAFPTNQKFCRNCGLGLQAVAPLVAQLLADNANASPAPDESSQAISSDKSDASRLTAWLVFLGVVVFLCGLLLFALNHILKIDRVVDLPAIFAALTGTLIMLYGLLYPKLHAPKILTTSSPADELSATTSDLRFLPETVSEDSIVEHTTRRLEPILMEPDNRSDS